MTCFHCALVKQIWSDESLYERKVSDWLFWLLYLWCGELECLGEEGDDQHSASSEPLREEGLYQPIRGLCCHLLTNQRPVLSSALTSWEGVWVRLNWIRMQCSGRVKIILLNCLTVYKDSEKATAPVHPHNLEGKCKTLKPLCMRFNLNQYHLPPGTGGHLCLHQCQPED